MQNGKGSARRKENFNLIQKNWDEINWGRNKECPKCKSSSQVWINQITGKLTCHRVGCGNLEIEDLITDGYQYWSKKCCMCGQNTMYVVRPGKVQCGNCD